MMGNILTGNKLANRLAVVPFLWIPIGAVASILRNEDNKIKSRTC